jgi:arsenate reductase
MSDSNSGQSPPARPSAFITAPPRHVLFLCVHNSARSQMAEGFARALAPEGAEVWSAGTEPMDVNPIARQVMEEVGIDLSAHRSKSIADVPLERADTIVLVCGEQEASCPRVASEVRKVHWPLPDPGTAPESERLQAFRDVRDEIKWRISSLWPRGD